MFIDVYSRGICRLCPSTDSTKLGTSWRMVMLWNVFVQTQIDLSAIRMDRIKYWCKLLSKESNHSLTWRCLTVCWEMKFVWAKLWQNINKIRKRTWISQPVQLLCWRKTYWSNFSQQRNKIALCFTTNH